MGSVFGRSVLGEEQVLVHVVVLVFVGLVLRDLLEVCGQVVFQQLLLLLLLLPLTFLSSRLAGALRCGGCCHLLLLAGDFRLIFLGDVPI